MILYAFLELIGGVVRSLSLTIEFVRSKLLANSQCRAAPYLGEGVAENAAGGWSEGIWHTAQNEPCFELGIPLLNDYLLLQFFLCALSFFNAQA